MREHSFEIFGLGMLL